MLDSIVAFIVPVVVIVLVLAVLAANIRVVQQSRAFVIERLGAFQTVWGVGLHFKIPFIERVAKNVSLKEQVVDFPPQPVITKDNVTMQIDTVIYFQITDPRLYTYGVENPMGAIENLTATTLRNGHQGQPGGAEEHHASPGHSGVHGEADAGRAGAP